MHMLLSPLLWVRICFNLLNSHVFLICFFFLSNPLAGITKILLHTQIEAFWLPLHRLLSPLLWVRSCFSLLHSHVFLSSSRFMSCSTRWYHKHSPQHTIWTLLTVLKPFEPSCICYWIFYCFELCLICLLSFFFLPVLDPLADIKTFSSTQDMKPLDSTFSVSLYIYLPFLIPLSIHSSSSTCFYQSISICSSWAFLHIFFAVGRITWHFAVQNYIPAKASIVLVGASRTSSFVSLVAVWPFLSTTNLKKLN